MWLGPELREACPPEFQDRLTDVGGVNRYEEPNFRLVWGQSETIRAGGVWDVPGIEGVQHYKGYRDIPLDGGEACWVLQQWMPGEFWGTPSKWYLDNFDPSCGLQILGEYPYKGRYQTVFQLVSHGEVNGKKVTEHMPLSSYLVDVVVPIVVMAKQISEAEKRAVIAERKAREEEGRITQIEDSLKNAYPTFGEIRSAAGLSCLSVVQKKVEEIERHWASSVDFVRQRGKGLSIN